jgi:hypothetical protein
MLYACGHQDDPNGLPVIRSGFLTDETQNLLAPDRCGSYSQALLPGPVTPSRERVHDRRARPNGPLDHLQSVARGVWRDNPTYRPGRGHDESGTACTRRRARPVSRRSTPTTLAGQRTIVLQTVRREMPLQFPDSPAVDIPADGSP